MVELPVFSQKMLEFPQKNKALFYVSLPPKSTPLIITTRVPESWPDQDAAINGLDRRSTQQQRGFATKEDTINTIASITASA